MVDANINNYCIPKVYTLLGGCFLTGFHALWDLPLHFSKSLNLCDLATIHLILCQSPPPITLFSHSGHFLFPDCSEFFPTTGPSHSLSPMPELLSTLFLLFRPSNFNLNNTSWKSKALARSHSISFIDPITHWNSRFCLFAPTNSIEGQEQEVSFSPLHPQDLALSRQATDKYC